MKAISPKHCMRCTQHVLHLRAHTRIRLRTLRGYACRAAYKIIVRYDGYKLAQSIDVVILLQHSEKGDTEAIQYACRLVEVK